MNVPAPPFLAEPLRRPPRVFGLALLLLLLALAAVSSARESAQAEAGGAVRHESQYGTVTPGQWSALDGPCNRFDDPRSFLGEVDEYVVLISKYLGRPAWLDRYGGQGKIEFLHEPDGYCHVEGGYYHFESPVLRVYLNETFKSDRAPLAHEITHLILPEYSSLSLREGLASEMQELFGRNAALYSLGADVHSLSARLFREIPPRLVESVGSPGIPGLDLMRDEEVRAAFYILSHSFSRYLLHRFGVATFLRLYESKDLGRDYRAVTGRGLEALQSEWQGFVALREMKDRQVAAAGEEPEGEAGRPAARSAAPGRHAGPL